MNPLRRLHRRLWPIRPDIAPYALSPASARRLAPDGDLAALFFTHSGRTVHKWTHYLELYQRHFAPFRGRPLRFLEIGVFKGGSLELWRKFFGPEAVIFGIDIDPVCAGFVDAPNQVRIGSQEDAAFLRAVVAEMGGVDVVLDDGSHMGRHIRRSFRTLFPLLADGGLYVIEDLHADYWWRWRPDRRFAMPMLKSLIDDLHLRYSGLPAAETDALGAMHCYDSIFFLEKRRERPTGHVQVPAPAAGGSAPA